jgi:hypothetical protein
MELLSRFFGPSFLVLWLSLKWGITTAYAATPSEEALLAHYLSYEEDPDYVRFVYEELKRAATLGAYDEALRRFLKAGMLLELKGKKINDFTAPLCPLSSLVRLLFTRF